MSTLLEAQSKYQRIRIEDDWNHPNDWILYLDDLFQLSTWSEYKYHESLITMPMVVAPSIDRIIICGGGDGMSLRESLRFKYCLPTLVELDPGMLQIFRDMPEYAKYNDNSFKNERANIIVGDAVKYLEQPFESKWNMIVWDFPGPKDDDSDAGLYTYSNLNNVINNLHEEGVFVTHVSIPIPVMYNLVKTLRARGFYCWTYDAYYSLDGAHDSFLVASRHPLVKQRNIPSESRWATNDRVRLAFSNATELTDEKSEYFMHFLDMGEFEQ